LITRAPSVARRSATPPQIDNLPYYDSFTALWPPFERS
jgi:hypothetical protein